MKRWRGIPVPAASRRTHLRAAALLWTAVGALLAAAGIHWMGRAGILRALPAVVLAGTLGWLKARFVLSRTAARLAQRIEERGDGRCLGGFLSFRSWLLVLSMMVLGRLLRLSPLPVPVRGLIYAAIGVGLFVAGLGLWKRAARVSAA